MAVAAYFGTAAVLWVTESVHLAVMLLELNVLETVCLLPECPCGQRMAGLPWCIPQGLRCSLSRQCFLFAMLPFAAQ